MTVRRVRFATLQGNAGQRTRADGWRGKSMGSGITGALLRGSLRSQSAAQSRGKSHKWSAPCLGSDGHGDVAVTLVIRGRLRYSSLPLGTDVISSSLAAADDLHFV